MKAFFGGKWQSPDQGATTTDVTNPYTGEVIETVPLLGTEVLDRVMPTLQKGVRSMAKIDRESLRSIFEKFSAGLETRQNELARMIVCEQGKPFSEAEAEVAGAMSSVRLLALNGSLAGAEILPISAEADFGNRYGFTVRHPHGVVAALTPSPQPLLLPVVAVCYALAAGNAVLLKPSSHTPLVALAVVEMLLEAGCPPDAIACLTGRGSELGRGICQHPGVHHIFCHGRLQTIRDMRSRSAFVTTQFQWSCVSSCVVMKTADMDATVTSLINAAMINAGQSAFSPSWVAVQENRHDELRERLKDRFLSCRLGDPLRPETQLGPVTTKATVRRLRRQIDRELANGAELVTGGDFEDGPLQRRITPLLLDGCNLESTNLCRREISGPVIGLTRIKKGREASIQLSDQRFHVLTFFTADEDWAIREAMRLPFDNIHVNGIPSWTDGLICIPGNPVRAGRSTAAGRVHLMSHIRDVICHERT